MLFQSRLLVQIYKTIFAECILLEEIYDKACYLCVTAAYATNHQALRLLAMMSCIVPVTANIKACRDFHKTTVLAILISETTCNILQT